LVVCMIDCHSLDKPDKVTAGISADSDDTRPIVHNSTTELCKVIVRANYNGFVRKAPLLQNKILHAVEISGLETESRSRSRRRRPPRKKIGPDLGDRP